MQRRVMVAAARYSDAHALRWIGFLLLTLILLSWSSSANATGSSSTPGPSSQPAMLDNHATTGDGSGSIDDGSGRECLEMTIPLENDGIIDVDAPEMGVKIEQWEGDEVLVIVEKTKRPKSPARKEPGEALNIVVTREGKNVRISARGGTAWRERGVDVSFRICLPDNYSGTRTSRDTNGLDRVTGILWKAIHRPALEWLTR